MKKVPISVLILAKNEASMLPGCLKCVSWCKEVIVLDDFSSDETAQLAKDAGATVLAGPKTSSFAVKRQALADKASEPWLLYVDPDERITPALAEELSAALQTEQIVHMQRQNYFFGQKMAHGGWQHDKVTRMFPKSALQGWVGAIHESPKLADLPSYTVSQPLWHFTHRTIREGLLKSASWTVLEAQAIHRAEHAPVTTIVVVRKVVGELYRRLWREKGYKDGQAGVFESFVQAINRALVYMQVWELDRQPPAASRYEKLETRVRQLWQSQV